MSGRKQKTRAERAELTAQRRQQNREKYNARKDRRAARNLVRSGKAEVDESDSQDSTSSNHSDRDSYESEGSVLEYSTEKFKPVVIESELTLASSAPSLTIQKPRGFLRTLTDITLDLPIVTQLIFIFFNLDVCTRSARILLEYIITASEEAALEHLDSEFKEEVNEAPWYMILPIAFMLFISISNGLGDLLAISPTIESDELSRAGSPILYALKGTERDHLRLTGTPLSSAQIQQISISSKIIFGFALPSFGVLGLSSAIAVGALIRNVYFNVPATVVVSIISIGYYIALSMRWFTDTSRGLITTNWLNALKRVFSSPMLIAKLAEAVIESGFNCFYRAIAAMFILFTTLTIEPFTLPESEAVFFMTLLIGLDTFGVTVFSRAYRTFVEIFNSDFDRLSPTQIANARPLRSTLIKDTIVALLRGSSVAGLTVMSIPHSPTSIAIALPLGTVISAHTWIVRLRLNKENQALQSRLPNTTTIPSFNLEQANEEELFLACMELYRQHPTLIRIAETTNYFARMTEPASFFVFCLRILLVFFPQRGYDLGFDLLSTLFFSILIASQIYANDLRNYTESFRRGMSFLAVHGSLQRSPNKPFSALTAFWKSPKDCIGNAKAREALRQIYTSFAVANGAQTRSQPQPSVTAIELTPASLQKN